MSNKLLYSGKAKNIFSTDDEQVILARYKDQATAFNGVQEGSRLLGKGVLKQPDFIFYFEKLNAAGVATHFIEKGFGYGPAKVKK